MKLIRINKNRVEDKNLQIAARKLSNGKLVVFPTETVYGLGANAEDKEAISKVYRVKKRPAEKPLSLHIADFKIFYNYIKKPLDEKIKDLIDEFWPGPLTLVVETEKGKKGFRMPDNIIAKKLIKLSKVPVVAPSANISGEPAPKSYKEISTDISKEVDIIIDAGKTGIGVESTVLDTTVSPFKVLREGALKEKEIKEVVYNGKN